MKKCLLIVAHGSKKEESNDEVRSLVKKVAKMCHEFFSVKVGFLENAHPLISEALEVAVLKKVHQIVVLPYFLSEGRHVSQDIPSEVKAFREKNASIDIVIAPYFGHSQMIPKILIDQAKKVF